MAVAESLEGVTEARPGNYVFFDGYQEAIGSCEAQDVAFSVLASVIGRYPSRGSAVIDAGGLALSKDPGARHVEPDGGFGRLLSLESGRVLAGARLTSLSQEHGVVSAPADGALDELRVGEVVRVVPNHSCLSAACFDRYHVVRGDEVVDQWQTIRGW